MNPGQDSQQRQAEGVAVESGLVGGRYQIERSIGRGGMATVYEVLDLTTQRRLALKRVQPQEDARKRRRSVQLFEREYHTLVHLAHPRVIEVYDYGVDEFGPYYTMELLDGGDLQKQAPVEWKRACALARDVCSALSLLHSRRMVYRDLSPRNVRCTSDGFAKLLDFGAMVMMGPSKQVVGTPAYCAPEALNLQPLDQRTDLYSLGATLYYTLVGRHAYPARDFTQLRDHWRSRVVRPSSIVWEVPAALDALVMDLMHLDPAARPANAAEVMERLAAIEGRALDEHLLVSQSYLSTPNLVGREMVLSRARAKSMRALRGRGGAMLIEGPSGVGRSRFLDACLLEAKLLGALVVRADVSDAQGDYGVVRALSQQVLHAVPELALGAARSKLSVLGHAVPELLVRVPGVALQTFETADVQRAQVLAALREWLLEVSRSRSLMIAVDDLHAIDEPSAAFIALLARDVRRRSLMVAVTAEKGATAVAPAALQVFADASTKFELSNLNVEHSESLLRSVFGDVAHVQSLSHKLHAISDGNPRSLMQLAQHLLDKHLVRYQAGAWTLPANIDAGDLPANMTQALKARIDGMSAGARELGRAMALCPERGVTFDECAQLCDAEQSASVLQSLDELVQAQVVSVAGDYYQIDRRGWVTALHADMDEPTARALHGRLARMFELRGGEDFRVAQHLLRAGHTERGLDTFIADADASQKITDQNPEAFYKLLHSIPADWFACYEHAISLCEQLGRPKRDAYTLRSRLAGLLGLLGAPDRTHLPNLVAQLRRESGLADWDALETTMEPMARLTKALELTQERFAKSSDHERGLEPIVAIRQLARAEIQACSVATTNRDYAMLSSLPSLAPLAPLSPALAVVDTLIEGTTARVGGRIEQARAAYARLLERTAQPDRGGLDETHHRYVRFGVMSGMGLLEAALGFESSLEWARQIDVEPMHQINALLIRTLYYLWCGEIRQAEECKERIELVRIESSPRQYLGGSHLVGQLTVNAATDDLTRIKQTIDEIEPLAQLHPGWVPVHVYGVGEYQRIRGDRQSALERFEHALSLMQPGCHQIWPNVAGARARALFELERYPQARDQARHDLAAADSAGHGNLRWFIQMPLSLAQSKLGESAEAMRIADSVIEEMQRIGARGVLLGLAYETRALVAIEAGDASAFTRYAALCAEQFRAGSSRVLTAKYERLKQVAVRAEIQVAPEVTEAPNLLTEPLTGSQLTSLFDVCRGFEERAQRCLSILLRQSGASEGFLYMLSKSGPELAARSGDVESPSHLFHRVRDYIDAEIRDQDVSTASLDLESSPLPPEWTGPSGERLRLVLLSHPVETGSAITGVAVVVVWPGKPFVYPGPIAMQLSRILLESGDVVPAIVAA